MSTRLSPRLFWLLIADSAIIYAGVMMALYVRLTYEGAIYQLNDNYGWLKIAIATVVCLISLYIYDLYEYTVIANRRELLLRLIQALGIAWALLALLFYFVPILLIGRGVSIVAVTVVLLLLLLWRVLIHSLTGHPDIGEKIIIVGTGATAREIAQATQARRDAGYRVVGFLTENGVPIGSRLDNIEILGTTDELETVIKGKMVDRLVIALRERRGTFPTDSLLTMSLAGNVNIEECAAFFERVTGKVHSEMLRPSWLIFEGRGRSNKIQMFIREILHRSMGLLGLILSLPIAMITAVLIKIDSSGPVFYRQERIGKNGRKFKVVKFRSMKTDAEIDGAPVWASSDDDRVTRVGRVIRKIRIDEIPQFWNIIKGEMSFVGPRPERPHFVNQLAKEIPYYEHRHLLAPGLTGWAQIKYPYGASVEDARQKLQYDLYYIKNQSISLDMVIVFETVKTVLFGRGR